MKARQLFTASLGLALLALILWMIMSDGDPETHALPANTISDSPQELQSSDIVSKQPDQGEAREADNSQVNFQEGRPPVQPPKPPKSLNAENKLQIPARPEDIPTEEYVKKNKVFLDKISRNYQRILHKKKGN